MLREEGCCCPRREKTPLHSPLARAVLFTLAGTLGATIGSVAIIFCADLLIDGFTARFDNYALGIGIPLAVAPLPIYPLTYLVYRAEKAQAELARMARTDPLTGVANRRGFFERAEAEFAAGDGRGLALMMVDIDRFKRVNDVYGHAAGDELLLRMADLIGKPVRDAGGFFGRIGGEEFAVMVPAQDAATATALAEQLCHNARLGGFEWDEHYIFATLSIGVAVHKPGQTFDATMKAADMAAYDAKRAGRDRWSLAGHGSLIAAA
jgi:diguanylate cyclase (GGDEF)-like protein